MDKEHFYIYLGILGLIIFIGFIIMIASIGGSHYYSGQEYNHLPAYKESSYEEPKPAAIQHYEEKRERSFRGF